MSTLYIIGNGFDLKHNIPSRYSDFAKFVKETDLEFYLRMELFYPYLSKNGLWSNFEEALGLPNLKELTKDYELVKKTNTSNREKYIGVNPITLHEAFGKWIFALTELISENIYDKKYQIETNSLFISFNYTRILECLYNVEESKICYIHECVPKDKKSKEMFTGYIYGHGREPTEFDLNDITKIEKTIDDDLLESLRNAVNDHKKEIKGKELNNFISSNKHYSITDIVILGHSLATVDHPYFKYLKNEYTNIKWHIGYFDNEDKIKKISYCREIGLTNIDFFNDK